MLRARYPLIYIVGVEEDPIEDLLQQVAQFSKPPRQLFFWDLVSGWHDNHNDTNSVMGAISRVAQSADQSSIFVLKDIHFILKNPDAATNAPVIRSLKNLISQIKHTRKTLVLTSYVLTLPPELQEEVTVIDFPLPSISEINYLIDQLVVPEKLKLSPMVREQVVKACQGLSRARIRRVLAAALATKGMVNDTDIDSILRAKKEAVRQTGILEFYSTTDSLKNVGGLENLKCWVRMRQQAFSESARQYGIPNPKGLLLVGIQGTGKSLSAKTIAYEWRLPLLRLDIGRLFGGIVGESESRVRQMIQLAEAISPCVLWMDELDKAFGNITGGGDGDSGTSRRVFGSLITWMQEKTSPVFIVATANNVRILPAELLRKGRFDEIFFLNLPTPKERREIFQVHLQKIRPSRMREFDLEKLSESTHNFSGAEIEQVIIDGMHRAFATRLNQEPRDFTTDDILMAISETVPLATIAKEQINGLKHWAAEAGARTASMDVVLEKELKTFNSHRVMGPLEVD
ncbi:AAA family ATPase [Cylindrospermopsis raciborskii MVCC19]|nr:AAA family ATPase [Cylindrospermopsis raciborskii MVCC19]